MSCGGNHHDSIAFVVAEDPVRLGLVASLARPGGNMTGVNFLSAELVAKRLELLRELVPAAGRVAVLVNSSNVSRAEKGLISKRLAASYSAGGDIAADLSSALCTGTHLDIAANDQIRPIATTTAIATIHARICFPSAPELAYLSPPQCEAVHRCARFFEA